MLKTFLIFSALVAALFFLAEFDVPHTRDLASESLEKFTFEPLAYALIFCTGVLCLVPDRTCGHISRFFESYSPKVRIAYEASAGSLLGWSVGSGLPVVLNNGVIKFPVFIGVCSIILLVTMVPLWAFESIGGIAKRYKQFMISERKGLLVIRLCGVVFVVIASWGYIQWWCNG